MNRFYFISLGFLQVMEPNIETRLESEDESMNKNFNNNEITNIVDHEITKNNFDNSSSDDCCKKCGNSEKQELLLLCDKCDNGWHTFCLSPALTEVPEGKSTLWQYRLWSFQGRVSKFCQNSSSSVGMTKSRTFAYSNLPNNFVGPFNSVGGIFLRT